MDKNISVLIVDDNKALAQELSNYISAEKGMTVAGTANDGEEAYMLILETEPDVVILDLIMPKQDGISVLKRLNNTTLIKHPIIILHSMSLCGMNAAKSLNPDVKHSLLKPQSFSYVCATIRYVINKNEEEAIKSLIFNKDTDIEKAISYFLNTLGMPAHLRGYQYCRCAILMIIENPKLTLSSAVTTLIYPQIADAYKTKPLRVERGIRHAIETAWARGDPQIKDKYFGLSYKGKLRPTNAEFIITIADQIRIGMKSK